MQNIERQMSKDELTKLTEDGIPGVDLKKISPEEKFKKEVIKFEQKATKESKPFARHAAMDDRSEYQEKVKQTIKRMGYLPKDFQKYKTDWKKYSDIKNFKLVETKERPDTNLSNKNPGLNVTSLTKVYQYTGYDNKYIIMESGPDSIKRAVINRAKLDKAIS